MQPKSYISLDNADHLLRRRDDADYAASVLAAWASRYLPAIPEQESESSSDLAPGSVMVSETGESLFTNQVTTRQHQWLADEPKTLGGVDKGPAPYDFLLAALGSCTTMTLRLYANRKKIALTKASVILKHKRLHAKDCADCENNDSSISELSRTIILEGNLTNEQRQRLLEIADKCPVHRTLENEIKIRTALSQ